MREKVEMLKKHSHLLPVDIDDYLLIGDVNSVKKDRSARRYLKQVKAP